MMTAAIFLQAAQTPKHYPLSLHDALPISEKRKGLLLVPEQKVEGILKIEVPRKRKRKRRTRKIDRKSTRLNSSHLGSSYAVFCLKKKNTTSPWSDVRSGSTDVAV